MSVTVTLKNPETNILKSVKIGWSWTMLFFASAWGIIWFVRGLYDWGIALLLYCLFFMLLGQNETLYLLLGFVSLGINIWAALNGNKITAKRYLSQGYEFAEPKSDAVQFAKQQWQIA